MVAHFARLATDLDAARHGAMGSPDNCREGVDRHDVFAPEIGQPDICKRPELAIRANALFNLPFP